MLKWFTANKSKKANTQLQSMKAKLLQEMVLKLKQKNAVLEHENAALREQLSRIDLMLDE